MSGFSLTNDYDSSGQPNSIHSGNHLYSNSTNNNDWLKKDISKTDATKPIYWIYGLGMSPNRWGNGVTISTQTTPEGILYGTANYQSTKWIHPENDPCPPGFRVPTQDELERIYAYDCRPDQADDGFTTNNVSGTLTGKGLTWIPVVCNTGDYPGRCFPSADWVKGPDNINGMYSSGYAVYETEEWEAATKSDGVGAYKDWNKTTTDFNSTNSDGTYKYPSLHEETIAPEPLLFLPAAGNLPFFNGPLNSTGLYGFYWSSTVSGTGANVMYFKYNLVDPDSETPRADGCSIRCVAEQ
jgi:hypothetical protein